MAITYVSSDSAISNTVSLPGSWAAQDIAIVVALNGSSNTIPSLPSGWTSLANIAGSAAARAGYRLLQSGDTTIGTWTNATNVGVSIWRGVHQSAPFDHLSLQSGLGTGNYATSNPSEGTSASTYFCMS